MNDKERTWIDNATRYGGSFVDTFARACLCADDANFAIMKPVLGQMMEKYPKYLESR